MMTPTLLAALVWPGLFIGGAAAVSAPIIIHFLARRRYKRIRWAAMEFLVQAEQQNRRRVLLEEIILLLMRCLAVLLIALLVARPFVRPEGLAALMEGAGRTERIFVIDDSFSTGYRSGDETSFSRAKRGVNHLIRLLREQSPNDTVTVLRTSDMDSPVAAGLFLDERQTAELMERIEGLTVSQRGLSSRDTMQAVREMLDDQPGIVSATIYLFSDFQRKDWVDTAGASQGSTASPIAPLASWRGEDRGLELILVDVGDDLARNIAITSLATGPAQIVAGVGGIVNVGVSNFSPDASDPIDLDLTVGALAQPTISLDQVSPGDTIQVAMDVTIPRPQWESVSVSVPQDALSLDDQRVLAVEAADAIRVLIVNGEPSSDIYRDEVALLRTALRPAGEIYSGNEVRVVDETELEEIMLERFHVVMLANVYRVSLAAAEALNRYVFEGGGLAIFLGDQVDPEGYNATLYADGRGLLPARLLERTAAPGEGVQMAADDELHPMVRVFTGADNPFVKNIRFAQYITCEPTRAEADESGNPAPRGDPAAIIAHFSDPNRTPAIVERAYGRGRVTLVTTTCDLEWNDWAKDPSYVVAMLELAQHLSRGRGSAAETLVGSPIEFSIDPQVYETDVFVRTPGYPAEQEVAITAAPSAQGRGFRVNWQQTSQCGVYRFVLTKRSGEREVRMVAVNPDPTESDLTPATEPDLRQALHEMPFEYFDGIDALDDAGDESRKELWPVVLIAVLVLLMAEQFLGWRFGRRS